MHGELDRQSITFWSFPILFHKLGSTFQESDDFLNFNLLEILGASWTPLASVPLVVAPVTAVVRAGRFCFLEPLASGGSVTAWLVLWLLGTSSVVWSFLKKIPR